MYQIVAEKNDGTKRKRIFPTREAAVLDLQRILRSHLENTPNNPYIDSFGKDSVSVCIGVQKIYTYTIEAVPSDVSPTPTGG